jgi:hypothetical protein
MTPQTLGDEAGRGWPTNLAPIGPRMERVYIIRTWVGPLRPVRPMTDNGAALLNKRPALAAGESLWSLSVPAGSRPRGGGHRWTVPSPGYASSVMQATVNTSRAAVAAKFGLQLPVTLAEERDMWPRVFWFVLEPFEPKYEADLDGYRVRPDMKPTAADDVC